MPSESTRGLKIFLWMVFGVVFALLPIGINYINGRVGGSHQSFVTLTKGGELFLVASAIGADAIGRVFLGGKKWRRFRIGCGVGCFLLVVATSIYFGNLAYAEEQRHEQLMESVQFGFVSDAMAQVQAEIAPPRAEQKVRVSHDSAWLFLFTFCAALGVLLVEENGQV